MNIATAETPPATRSHARNADENDFWNWTSLSRGNANAKTTRSVKGGIPARRMGTRSYGRYREVISSAIHAWERALVRYIMGLFRPRSTRESAAPSRSASRIPFQSRWSRRTGIPEQRVGTGFDVVPNEGWDHRHSKAASRSEYHVNSGGQMKGRAELDCSSCDEAK